MNISGRFSRVSKTDYHDGIVLVGFCGDVYPHDLTTYNIDYIKTFYNMNGCKHEFFSEWPEEIKPAYPAARKNFVNGFMLLRFETKCNPCMPTQPECGACEYATEETA